MSLRDLERRLQAIGLSRSQARMLMARGRRWRWLASFSVVLYAHFTVWRIK
jgi:hypothetical protein